jgi:SH3-like domain-containing protein
MRPGAASLVLAVALAGAAHAAEYRATAEAPTILYDGPSAKAKPQFLYGRDVPVEVIVVVEGWAKVRDAGGTIGWIERKALADKRTLLGARRRPTCASAPRTPRRSCSAPSRTCCSSSPRPRARRRRRPIPAG